MKHFLLTLLISIATLIAIPGKSAIANQYCLGDAECGSQLGCYGNQVASACVQASYPYCCQGTLEYCCHTLIYQCGPNTYCQAQMSCPQALKCETYGCADCQYLEQ